MEKRVFDREALKIIRCGHVIEVEFSGKTKKVGVVYEVLQEADFGILLRCNCEDGGYFVLTESHLDNVKYEILASHKPITLSGEGDLATWEFASKIAAK